MDPADIAQLQQETLLAKQLEQHKANQRNSTAAHNKNADGDYECIECGDIVETQRVSLGLTLRCSQCQHQHEGTLCKKL